MGRLADPEREPDMTPERARFVRAAVEWMESHRALHAAMAAHLLQTRKRMLDDPAEDPPFEVPGITADRARVAWASMKRQEELEARDLPVAGMTVERVRLVRAHLKKQRLSAVTAALSKPM